MNDDDKLYLDMSNDEKIEQELLMGIYAQDKNTLAYSVSNLYKDETSGQYRGRLSLLNQPPQLTLSNSEGDSVTFDLTENVTRELMRAFVKVNEAYSGTKYDMEQNKTTYQRIKDLPKDFKKDPIKYSLLLATIILAVGIAFLNSFW